MRRAADFGGRLEKYKGGRKGYTHNTYNDLSLFHLQSDSLLYLEIYFMNITVCRNQQGKYFLI